MRSDRRRVLRWGPARGLVSRGFRWWSGAEDRSARMRSMRKRGPEAPGRQMEPVGAKDPPGHSEAPSRLPSMAVALWRALQIGYQAEPALLVVSFALVAGSWVPASLGALWLKLLADGAVQHRAGMIAAGAAGLGLSVTAGWLLGTVGKR